MDRVKVYFAFSLSLWGLAEILPEQVWHSDPHTCASLFHRCHIEYSWINPSVLSTTSSILEYDMPHNSGSWRVARWWTNYHHNDPHAGHRWLLRGSGIVGSQAWLVYLLVYDAYSLRPTSRCKMVIESQAKDITRKNKTEQLLFPVTIKAHNLRHTSSCNLISYRTQFCPILLDCVFKSQDFLPAPFFIHKWRRVLLPLQKVRF